LQLKISIHWLLWRTHASNGRQFATHLMRGTITKGIVRTTRLRNMGRTRSNKLFGNTDPPPKLDFEKRYSRRGTNPTCTDFGVGEKRLVLHPMGYFCSNCDWYECQITSGGGKRIKRDNCVYACQANHYYWVYP